MHSLARHLFPAIPGRGVPHLCTSLLNRADDLRWEMWLGIKTRGGAPSRHDDARDYGYLAYHTYVRVLERLDLRPDDVVVDLGAGKGRAVCAAAQYKVREAVGVEIDPALHALACANGVRLRTRRAPVRFECRSAVDFDYDPATVIILFHPFGTDTMRAVLHRLGASLNRRPRELRIAYLNPIFDSTVAALPWLHRFDRWVPDAWSRLKFPVNFYQFRKPENQDHVVEGMT